ncbi:ABC transporter substrate-binding protein [Rhodoligotrophos ferricapiens]|uniref:ABC transporter substrate-binding protein n=1 Tax=Rhodoligotrophos ferricapiens TaxID=3069264 RepID=UPI00315D0A98
MSFNPMDSELTRRRLLQFLGALGITSVSGATLAGLEGAIREAHAQAAPGSVMPKLQAMSPNWPDMIEIWRQVTRDYAELGIDVEVQQGTLDTWVSQVVGEHKLPHLVSMSWGGAPDRMDPDFFLNEILNSKRAAKGGLNYGHYENPEYDKAANAQRVEVDEEKRRALVMEAQAIAAKDNPLMVLFHRDIIQAYNKAKFKGVTPIFGNGIGYPYAPLAYMGIEALTPRKMVKVTSIYDIASLNPFLTPEVYNSSILRLMYATFVTRDKDANIMPWAAESWTLVDPTTMDIVLRPNQTFHDGKPVTVEDVKFTFDYILKWKFPALARVVDSVKSAEITGDNTVRLKLNQPYAAFVPNVLGYAFIAPKHVWEKVPGDSGLASPADWPNDQPIGSGPWKYVEWRKGEYLNLAAHKEFFMPAKLDALVMLPVPAIENQIGMMERGEADVFGWTMDVTQGKRLGQNPEIEIVQTPTHGLHEIRFNLVMPPLDNPALRLALQHATDRKKYLDIIFSGAGTLANNSLITPVLKQWSNPDVPNPEPSLDKARQVLKDAGFTWDGNGKLKLPS